MEEIKVASQHTNRTNSQNNPRLDPIENPGSLKLKLAYWLTKMKMGKVITPLKVVQARMPDTLSLSRKLLEVEENLSLPDDLVCYIKCYIASLNGCSFCTDIAKAMGKDQVDRNKITKLMTYESADVFTESEKAALKYVEQATIEKEVTDAVFQALQSHFSEKKIIEITWLNALENYYNLINIPLQIESDNLCTLQ